MADKSRYNTFANQFVSAKEILKKFHCELLRIKFLSKWHTWDSNQMLLLYIWGQALCYEMLKSPSEFLWHTKLTGASCPSPLVSGSAFSQYFREEQEHLRAFGSSFRIPSGSSISFWSLYVERWAFYPCSFLGAKFCEEICCSTSSGWFKKQNHISNKTVPSNFPQSLGAQEAKHYYVTELIAKRSINVWWILHCISSVLSLT